MIPTQSDQHFMQLALQCAAHATMATSPNPKVGCVIVKNGDVIGQGWTQAVGQAHAEVQALRDAVMHGKDARGATAYVTLEPCSHFGRTPPCVNALIDAGIARVVAAIKDPNPQVAGRGLQLLQNAGVVVECGLLETEAREMNLGFFKRMETGKPWVRVKMAASLDGRTALSNGQSQWITAADARQDGHRWRAKSDAILTGIGTVVADDPVLNVRLDEALEYVRQPHKIILDSQLRISPKAKILHSQSSDSDEQIAKILIVHAQTQTEKYASLESTGAQLLFLPNRNGQIDLPALMLELGRQQINVLHVEAGATLSGALIAQGCVDELLLYYAPKLLGDGAGMFALPEISSVDQARQVKFHALKNIGETLRIVARFK